MARRGPKALIRSQSGVAAVDVMPAELHVIVVESYTERSALLTENPELKVGATIVVAGSDQAT